MFNVRINSESKRIQRISIRIMVRVRVGVRVRVRVRDRVRGRVRSWIRVRVRVSVRVRFYIHCSEPTRLRLLSCAVLCHKSTHVCGLPTPIYF